MTCQTATRFTIDEALDGGVTIDRSFALNICHNHDQQMAEFEDEHGISETGLYDAGALLRWLGY